MTAVPEAPGREITPLDRPALPKSGTPRTGHAGSKTPKAPKHHPRTGVRAIWQSSIGKKYVMSVTGLLMLAFLIAHMLGNLKIFFGPRDFNDYAAYLRTIGTPILHGAWFLWISRTALTIALGLHITAAYQLSRRDQKSRPVKYQHAQPVGGRWTTHTMRWGGLALLLFIIWHILDLSSGTVANGFHKGDVYANVVHDFSHWYSNVIYIVAMLALGLHINHGFWSASMTMGYNRPSRNKAIRATGTILAVGLTAGFILIPVSVMTGLVS